jgi:bacillopeptidase F
MEKATALRTRQRKEVPMTTMSVMQLSKHEPLGALAAAVSLLAALVTAPAGALAVPPDAVAKIAPALGEVLVGATADEQVPIIVMLQDRADLEQLNDEIYAAGLGRGERREIVIAALRDVAAASQPPLRARLDAWAAAGHVAAVRPFWLVNAIALRATPAIVERIAARGDVARVFLDGVIELVRPEEELPAARAPGQAERGLLVVNAPALWGLGYTGDSVIVMNIDSGVDATHPALDDRWLGHSIPAEQAWLDPHEPPSPTPIDYGEEFGSPGHGTHTMGTMTGLEEATADTTGVAFGATWIAAGLLPPPAGVSHIITAFEWAIDGGVPIPDRPPAGVINCSWGTSISHAEECEPGGTFWECIDNYEATGGAVVFAAGNDGPSPMTIGSPQNRISTPVNIWATGNIDGNTPGFPLRPSSSRGPSRCDSLTIKPEAVAPGTNVRAPVPDGYGLKTGTSMAAPHVAGVIALLMEAFPNRTGTEIKLALLATAMDLGVPGEDNDTGMGLINAGHAYEFLRACCSLFEPAATAPASSVTLAQNVPNPFNPSTSIPFELERASNVTLKIYNYRGQVVASLLTDARRDAGMHTVQWDGRTLSGERAASGLYAIKLIAWPITDTERTPVVRARKAVLLK